MLITSLNLVKAYAGWGWAGGYFWHLKEVMIASGRFVVVGSGDGNALFAYNGVTAALAGPDQGSGGAYDCWMSPKFTGMIVPQAGYTNASSWIVMGEVGSSREYLFVTTNQSTSGWDGYGRVAYNAGGGATPAFVGAAVNATTIPAAASNEVWLYGSARATPNGVSIFMYNTSGYVHCICDDTAENGATGFGFITANEPRAAGGILVCPLVSTPSWDTDPIIIVSGSNFGTAQGWNQLGFGGQAWGGVAINTRGLYNGASGTRITDGSASIRQMAVTVPSTYLKGFTGRIAGFAAARWAYPLTVEDRVGNRWVPTANGLMIRWDDSNPITLPR